MHQSVIDNVRDLRTYWNEVPPSNVYPDLNGYAHPCGTIACLAGHGALRSFRGVVNSRAWRDHIAEYLATFGIPIKRSGLLNEYVFVQSEGLKTFFELFATRECGKFDQLILAEHPDCSDWFLCAMRMDRWLAKYDPKPVEVVIPAAELEPA